MWTATVPPRAPTWSSTSPCRATDPPARHPRHPRLAPRSARSTTSIWPGRPPAGACPASRRSRCGCRAPCRLGPAPRSDECSRLPRSTHLTQDVNVRLYANAIFGTLGGGRNTSRSKEGDRMAVRRVRSASLAVLACLGILSSLLAVAPVGAAAAGPTVTPATGGRGVPVVPGFTAFDLATVGYQQSEVFLSGTAHAYAPAAPLGPDGKFSVAESAEAPYTTRAVVVRPIKKHRFNGTVVVEWLNVSGGADAGPDWILAHNQLVREGFAWVGISAQKVGVDALRSA